MHSGVEVELTIEVPDGAGGHRGVDVVVTAPASSSMEEVAPYALEAVGAAAHSALELSDGTPLPRGSMIGSPPLLRAAALRAVAPGAVARRTPGAVPESGAVALVAVHVVAGPDAGQVVRLAAGCATVGRGAALIRLHDPLVSRVHAQVRLDADGASVRDLGSANGTSVAGRAVGPTWQPWPGGSHLLVGSSWLSLVPLGGARASTRTTGDGHLEINLPPRLRPPDPVPTVIDVPTVPARPPVRPFPVIATLVPVLLAVPLALWWSPLALLMVVGSPVVAVATLVTDRRTRRRSGAGLRCRYARDLREALARARAAEAIELAATFAAHPDPADLLDRALALRARLWERRRADPDVLTLRLGLGPVVSGVSLNRPTASRARRHERAPWVVDLAQVGVLGVEGDDRRSLARSLVGQAAALVAPGELSVVVLCGATAGAQDWRWVRWLPHELAEGGGPGRASAVVATTDEEVARALERLGEALRERRARAGERDHRRRDRAPWILVVVDGSVDLRRSVALREVFADGPPLGVVAICLAENAQQLPVECAAVVSLRRGPGPMTSVHLLPAASAGGSAHAVADLVGPAWAEQLSRALAPLRVAAAAAAGQVPAQVRLVDLLADGSGPSSAAPTDPTDLTDPTDPASIAAAWRRGGRTTRAVLGARAGGVWAVDLRRDGPHVLVAGTTGSGKSELLAALVLALAVGNRPAELAVVLVDYKGGATFGPLARLPHAVGLVTDLDDHLTRRALTSLRAEVHRRERLLAEHGCRDIDELLSRHAAGQARCGLERLLIVVDEFRVLAEELPGFVEGLVRLAAVGRSLGIHLVLATQRPAGAVTPEIRANTNLRVALRVREEVDSLDVVESGEAARITADRPGRAVARTGGGPLVAVQVARVSGRPPPGVGGVVVRRSEHPCGADRPPARPTEREAVQDDLARVVAAVVEAAEGQERPPVPWTAPLPAVVTRSRLRAQVDAEGERPVGGRLPIGLLDDPSAQLQRVGWWAGRAPLAVVGPPRSGRTSALLAIGTAVADHHPHAVQLAVLQAPGGGLGGLSRLANTIAVVQADDHEHRGRVLRHLVAVITSRQQQPDRGGRGIVVLVDAADRLFGSASGDFEPDHEAAADLLLRVLVEGPAVGVVAAIAGGRALLAARTTAVVRERLLLGLTDPSDAVLAGVPAAAVPAMMPPGRALLVDDSGIHEVQVALVDPTDRPAPAQPATAGAQEVIGALPKRLSAPDLTAGPRRRGEVTIGVGGSRPDVRTLDLAATPLVLVAGRPRSGRTSLLTAIAQGLVATGVPFCAVAPAPSALSRWASERRLPVVVTSNDLLGPGLPAPVVLVDDVELLDRHPGEERLREALVAHLHRVQAGGGLAGGALVVAGSITDLAASYRGLVPLLRRAGTGVLMHPLGAGDVDLLGDRVPRARSGPPGRATLVRAGVAETVQLLAPQP